MEPEEDAAEDEVSDSLSVVSSVVVSVSLPVILSVSDSVTLAVVLTTELPVETAVAEEDGTETELHEVEPNSIRANSDMAMDLTAVILMSYPKMNR